MALYGPVTQDMRAVGEGIVARRWDVEQRAQEALPHTVAKPLSLQGLEQKFHVAGNSLIDN